MTLITTELHNHSDPDTALIVFAADRRISVGIMPDNDQVKIYELPKLNAGIGFFGLAEIPQAGITTPMSYWLKDFIGNIDLDESLEDLARRLCASLNSQVPKDAQNTVVSGFHIAGFSAQRVPEFWYVRNVDDDGETLFGEYLVREDFQGRDASLLNTGEAQIYRNGDIRAHVVAWEAIDESLGILLNTVDFRRLTTPNDYLSWVKFKMEMIAKFYEEFCTISIIGSPIDAFLFSAE